MKLYDKPAHILHDMLREKKINAVELTKDIIARMEKVEPKVSAYLMVTSEIALQQAQAVDKKIAGGEEITFLEGIPGALKDNICTQGITTTCASKILEHFVPPYNATVVEKLRAAGAPVL